MFIRKTKKKDPVTKKEYFFFQLIESYRTEKGPRQRILLNLGSFLDLNNQERKVLANRIEEIINGIDSFVPTNKSIESYAEKFAKQVINNKSLISEKNKKITDKSDYQEIDLSTIEHEFSRTVGVENISNFMLDKLGIKKELEKLNFSKRQIEIAFGLIIGRLSYPSSELATYNWLKNCSGLDEILETDFSKLSLRKVYETGTLLYKHKKELEHFLEQKEKALFECLDTVILYDLTNTYFEGSAKKHTLSKHGRSKEKRSDCPLITLGLVINQSGFIKKSRIYKGNISEPSTLQEIIKDLSITDKTILVMDAGFSSEENLEYLRDNKIAYICVSRKKTPPIDMENGQEIEKNKGQKITLKSVFNKELNELYLHCHSTGKEAKEKSIKNNFSLKFEEALQKLHNGLSKKRTIKDYNKILEKIGRLKEKYRRVSFLYEIKVTKNNEFAQKIKWERKEKQSHLNGHYILRSFGNSLSEKDLWNTYIMLTNIEDAFRCLKSDLGLRPIFHQNENSINAHLFITILAYHILHAIRFTLKQNKINDSWESIRIKMSTQTRVTTCMKNKSGNTIRIRTNTKPEIYHQKIFQALQIPVSIKRKKSIF